jgi:hypothetical protein
VHNDRDRELERLRKENAELRVALGLQTDDDGLEKDDEEAPRPGWLFGYDLTNRKPVALVRPPGDHRWGHDPHGRNWCRKRAYDREIEWTYYTESESVPLDVTFYYFDEMWRWWADEDHPEAQAWRRLSSGELVKSPSELHYEPKRRGSNVDARFTTR